MADLKQTIIERLQATGSPQTVARELNVSVSYVSRVQRSLTNVPPEMAAPTVIVPASTVTAAEVQPKDRTGQAAEMLSPNLAAVGGVRDKALKVIDERLDRANDGDFPMDGKDLTALLKIVLGYEIKLREVIQPSLTVVNDQRTQSVHLYHLVDRLAGEVDIEKLRELSGVPKARMVIDGEVSNG